VMLIRTAKNVLATALSRIGWKLPVYSFEHRKVDGSYRSMCVLQDGTAYRCVAAQVSVRARC
jgi:hypothetical protein